MVSQCPRGSSQILYPTEAKNWAYLLNDRERKVVSVIKEKYKKRFGRPAVNDKNLLAHLGDNPQTHLKLVCCEWKSACSSDEQRQDVQPSPAEMDVCSREAGHDGLPGGGTHGDEHGCASVARHGPATGGSAGRKLHAFWMRALSRVFGADMFQPKGPLLGPLRPIQVVARHRQRLWLMLGAERDSRSSSGPN